MKQIFKHYAFRALFGMALIFKNLDLHAAQEPGLGKNWLICADERYGHIIWSVNRVKLGDPNITPVDNAPYWGLSLLDIGTIIYEGTQEPPMVEENPKAMLPYSTSLSLPIEYVLGAFESLGNQMKPGWHPEIGMAYSLSFDGYGHTSCMITNEKVLVVRSSRGNDMNILRHLTDAIYLNMITAGAIPKPIKVPEFGSYGASQIARFWKDVLLPPIYTHPKSVTVYPELGVIGVTLNDTNVNLETNFLTLIGAYGKR